MQAGAMGLPGIVTNINGCNHHQKGKTASLFLLKTAMPLQSYENDGDNVGVEISASAKC
jgi:hypothetical protein